jgi:tryptophanyl-tRNA synthetase
MATPFIKELRHAVGLRPLSSFNSAATAKDSKVALPSFKQYREKDGQFYFKFIDAQGQLLLQSIGFASPKEAGQTIARLTSEGMPYLQTLEKVLENWLPETLPLIELSLNQLRMAQLDKEK